MIDKEGGDFGGNYEIPASIRLDREEAINADVSAVNRLYKELEYAGARQRVNADIVNPFMSRKSLYQRKVMEETIKRSWQFNKIQ